VSGSFVVFFLFLPLASHCNHHQDKYAITNVCKETLKDVLRRRMYDSARDDFVKGIRRSTFSVGPPRTSALMVMLLLASLVSWIQFTFLRRNRQALYDEKARFIIARQKATPEVMEELKRDFQLDSVWSLVRELWLPRLVMGIIPQLKMLLGTLSSADGTTTQSNAGTGATRTGTVAAPIGKRQSPSDAASSTLMWQGIRFMVVAVVLVFAWGFFTDFMGTKTPFYVVTTTHMALGGLSVGDVLVLRWGRNVIDSLGAGDVCVCVVVIYFFFGLFHSFLLF
jgi:hypothetical protein